MKLLTLVCVCVCVGGGCICENATNTHFTILLLKVHTDMEFHFVVLQDVHATYASIIQLTLNCKI